MIISLCSVFATNSSYYITSIHLTGCSLFHQECFISFLCDDNPPVITLVLRFLKHMSETVITDSSMIGLAWWQVVTMFLLWNRSYIPIDKCRRLYLGLWKLHLLLIFSGKIYTGFLFTFTSSLHLLTLWNVYLWYLLLFCPEHPQQFSGRHQLLLADNHLLFCFFLLIFWFISSPIRFWPYKSCFRPTLICTARTTH